MLPPLHGALLTPGCFLLHFGLWTSSGDDHAEMPDYEGEDPSEY